MNNKTKKIFIFSLMNAFLLSSCSLAVTPVAEKPISNSGISSKDPEVNPNIKPGENPSNPNSTSSKPGETDSEGSGTSKSSEGGDTTTKPDDTTTSSNGSSNTPSDTNPNSGSSGTSNNNKPNEENPEEPNSKPGNPEIPNVKPEEKPEEPNSINPPNSEENNQFFDNYSLMLGSTKAFQTKNFETSTLSTNNQEKYLKKYPLNSYASELSWNLDINKQTLSWTFDVNKIQEILNSDSSNQNVKLWLFIDYRTESNEMEYSSQFLPFSKDQIEKNRLWGSGYNFDYNTLKTKSITFDQNKYFKLIANFDNTKNKINFLIQKKSGVTQNFTDNYVEAITKNNFIYFPYFNNVFNLSFESNNQINQTITKMDLSKYQKNENYISDAAKIKLEKGSVEKNQIADQYERNKIFDYYDVNNPWKISPNSNDKSTQEENTFYNWKERKKDNIYKRSVDLVLPYNDFALAREMRIRTFRKSTGTATMLQKVKPSDPNDERYYVITALHVNTERPPMIYKWSEDFWKKSKELRILQDSKFVYETTYKDDYYRTFWQTNQVIDKLGKTVFSYLSDSFRQKAYDFKIGVLDLKILKKIIEKHLNEATDELVKLNDQGNLKDLAEWSNYQPLKFTKKYNNFYSISQNFLTNWLIQGYGVRGYNQYKINRFQDYSNHHRNPNGYKFGAGTSAMLNGEIDVFTSGGDSGSSVVDADRNLVGIFWGYVDGQPYHHRIAAFFNTNLADIIGSNIDFAKPSENPNTHSFCHRVIREANKDPNSYEILPMCKNL